MFGNEIGNSCSGGLSVTAGVLLLALNMMINPCYGGVSEVTEFGNLPAPSSLALEDISGEMRSLEEFRGSVVVVNFWATWCPPCIREFPSLERLKGEMADRPLEILAVNAYESKSKVKRFRNLPKNGVRVLMDNTGKETEKWFVKVYPTSFILDIHGRVVRMLVGEYDWDSAEVREWVETLSKEPPANQVDDDD